MPTASRVLAAGVLVALALTHPGVDAKLSAQVSAGGRSMIDPGRIAMVHQPRSTLVAVSVALPVGSSEDPVGEEGLALLSASAVRRMLEERFGVKIALIQSEATRNTTTFTLLSRSDRPQDTLTRLTAAIFGSRPTAAHVEDAIAEIRARATFEAGAPVRAFDEELFRWLSEGDERWATPVAGYPGTVEALTVDAVDDFIRRRYSLEEATVGLVAAEPITPSPSAQSVESDSVRPRTQVMDRRSGSVPQTSDWGDRERQVITREVTNSWVAISIDTPEDVDDVTLELIAHALSEVLNPDPPDPGIYWAEASRQQTPTGWKLLVVSAVFPEVAETMEGKIMETLEGWRDSTPGAVALDGFRRRHWTAQVLGDSKPEELSARIANELLVGRSRSTELREVVSIGEDEFRAAVSSLGRVRMLLYGPDLSGG